MITPSEEAVSGDVRLFCAGPHGPYCTPLARSVQPDHTPADALGLKLELVRDATGDFQPVVCLKARPELRNVRLAHCPFCGARFDGGATARIPGLDLPSDVLALLRTLPFTIELGLVLYGGNYLNLTAPDPAKLRWCARAGAWSNDSIHGSSDERTTPREAVLTALRARASACLRVAEDRDAEAKKLRLAERKAFARERAKELRDEAETIRVAHDRLLAIWPESANGGGS